MYRELAQQTSPSLQFGLITQEQKIVEKFHRNSPCGMYNWQCCFMSKDQGHEVKPSSNTEWLLTREWENLESLNLVEMFHEVRLVAMQR